MATKKSSKSRKNTSAKKSKRTKAKIYSKSYYEKRPIWQWIVIYTIIAAIVYGFIYYAVLSPKGGNNYKSPKGTVNQNYQFKFQ